MVLKMRLELADSAFSAVGIAVRRKLCDGRYGTDDESGRRKTQREFNHRPMSSLWFTGGLSADTEHSLQRLPKMAGERIFRRIGIAPDGRIQDFQMLLQRCDRQRFRDKAILPDKQEIFVQTSRGRFDQWVAKG